MRFSASTVTALWLGSLIFLWLGPGLSAQERPRFRFEPRVREELLPRPSIARSEPPAASHASISSELFPKRIRFREELVTLRRHPLREITLPPDGDPYTLRNPDGSALAVRLSLGWHSEIRFTDNVGNAPPALAVQEILSDVTPILRINIGDNPDHRTMDWIESEYYLDAIYAPTWHRLHDAQELEFLHHLIARAGRVTPLLQAAIRVEYDDNLFASSNEGSPEDTFTLFEVVPTLEYRPSVVTKLHFRGEYRRITLENPLGNRTEYIADIGIDVAMSVKTTAGLGAQMGHIEFDQPDFGTQRYGQGYVAILWQATRKVSFQTRIGIERREFDRPIPQERKVGPVATAGLIWQPSDRTRFAGTFSLRNQPSVVQQGSLFEDMRFALQATQDLGSKFYARLEADVANRDYDTGLQEMETMVRPALGYRLPSSALLDAAQVEVFYQFRRRWNTGGGEDFASHQAGMQLTIFF